VELYIYTVIVEYQHFQVCQILIIASLHCGSLI